MTLGENKNPHLAWSNIPEEAQSLILICVDTDVPSSVEHFNKEGATISAALPRVEFMHWVMVDIRPIDGGVSEGECSDGITPGGKQNPNGPEGSRQGINDYTSFMAGDPEMEGNYFGYEGPCPPWNDEIAHHYRFKLFACDFDVCPVAETFTGQDVLKVVQGHILSETELTGLYSLNPNLS
jgi:Raf kinase inhibitor-like YbhB/YbcL family protein